MEASSAAGQEIYQRISRNIKKVIQGQDKAIRKVLAGFVSGSHVLLEDYPGTGKTTLALALAKSTGLTFKRIQFTPDLLPSDILGVAIFDQQDNSFHFHHGPIFAEIVLADEINRASPRTQSALLEAMAEGQVSVDGKVMKLDELFFVLATQNPVESHGTYPLPEAQLDRFGLKFSLGYVSVEEECAILQDQQQKHPLETLAPCASRQELQLLRQKAKNIRISPELQRYCVTLAAATRRVPGVLLGASPRGSLTLMKIARALALFDGLDFVVPDHIQEVAIAVLAHRLALAPQSRFAGTTAEDIIANILKDTSVPA